VHGNSLNKGMDPSGLGAWAGYCFNNPLNRNDSCASIGDTNQTAAISQRLGDGVESVAEGL
jgi:hypothetical protein